MFQYKALNKRLVHVLFDSLLTNLFQSNLNSTNRSSQIQSYIRNYLTKSPRVKPEWKQASTSHNINPLSCKSNSSFSTPVSTANNNNLSNSMPRSKSIHSYVQC